MKNPKCQFCKKEMKLTSTDVYILNGKKCTIKNFECFKKSFFGVDKSCNYSESITTVTKVNK